MTIGEMLSEQARLHPTTVALIDARSGRRLTFAALEEAVAQAAGWWQLRGLRRGQAVLVFVPMSIDLYVALLGLFRIGVVALFLDPSAGIEHLEKCCERWPPDAFLAIPKAHLLRLRSAALRRIPLKISLRCWIPGARRWPTDEQVVPQRKSCAESDDAALVTFTSGSTGVPKAAVRTHRFLLDQYRALAPGIALEIGDIDYATLPVFVLANLAAGITTVLPGVDLRRPGRVDAQQAFTEIEAHGVTRVTASPAFFERLIAHGQGTGRTLASLKKIHTGGAPVFLRVLDGLRLVAPTAQIVAVYGSTEAEPIAHIDLVEVTQEDRAAMMRGEGLLAGKPVSEIRWAILQDQWGQPRADLTEHAFSTSRVPVGQIGEIVVTGDHVLKGYLQGVGNQETKFRVGNEVWHRTGDAGSVDSAGRLWLHGRCAAVINDERGRLYPFGVECAAMMFAQVLRAAVLSEGGKRLLVIEGKLDTHETRRLAEATAWAHIDRICPIPQLPVDKRHNAKVDYPELRKLLHRSG